MSKRVYISDTVSKSFELNAPGAEPTDCDSIIVHPDLAKLPGRMVGLRVDADNMEPLIHVHDVLIIWYGGGEKAELWSRQRDLFVVTTEERGDTVGWTSWDEEFHLVVLESFNKDYMPVSIPFNSCKLAGLVVMINRLGPPRWSPPAIEIDLRDLFGQDEKGEDGGVGKDMEDWDIDVDRWLGRD